MRALWITLACIAGALLLILLLLFLGKVRVRIFYKKKGLRVTLSVLGIPFTLLSDKKPLFEEEKAPKDLAECNHPDSVLKEEMKRQLKAAKKARRKRKRLLKKQQRKASQPTPSLKENLDMITAIVKKVRRLAGERVRVRVKRLQITVSSDDASKTAILYGVTSQSVAYLIGILEACFTHVKRKPGEVFVKPDFVSERSTAKIGIVFSASIFSALRVIWNTISVYQLEKLRARRRAAARVKRKQSRKKSVDPLY